MPYEVRRKNLSHADVTTSGGGGSSKSAKRKNAGKRNQINEVIIKDPIDKIRDAASGVVGKLSKYVGGFIRTGNRMNNSKAYNHDYYIHNKHKWKVKASSDSKPTATTNEPERYAFDFGDPTLQFNRKSKSARDLYYEKYKDILGTVNKRFKYIYKVLGANNKYRYFYSHAEYYKFMENVPQKTHAYTIAEDMSAVNKLYTNKNNPDDAYLYKENCGFCTMAYDLRRRGYDVQAIPRPGYGISSDTIANLYETKDHEDVRPTVISVRDDDGNYVDEDEYTNRLFDSFEKGGDGASGEVHVNWFGGGGHSMAYQVVDGKGYVLDCQTNTIYDREDYKTLITPNVSSTGYTRLDDKILKEDSSKAHPIERAAATQKLLNPGADIFDWKLEYNVVTYNEKLVGDSTRDNDIVHTVKGFDTRYSVKPGDNTLDTYKLLPFLPDKERIVSYTVEDASENKYHSRPIVTGAGGVYYDENGRSERITTRVRGTVGNKK